MKNKKEMPYDFWNHGINPILGYRWTQPPITPQESKRNKNEYPEVDDYNPNKDNKDYKVDDGVIAYFTR